jgi:hypothetical protein
MLAAGLLALNALAVTADGQGTKFATDLMGLQEVPVVSSQARGRFTAQILADGSISYELSYSGLEGGNTLFAHIHLAQKGVNGGVMTFLCGGGTKPTPCPNGSGSVTGVITATDILGLATQQVPAGAFDEFRLALHQGVAYANVHTTASPGGEIRGQILVDHR